MVKDYGEEHAEAARVVADKPALEKAESDRLKAGEHAEAARVAADKLALERDVLRRPWGSPASAVGKSRQGQSRHSKSRQDLSRQSMSRAREKMQKAEAKQKAGEAELTRLQKENQALKKGVVPRAKAKAAAKGSPKAKPSIAKVRRAARIGPV